MLGDVPGDWRAALRKNMNGDQSGRTLDLLPPSPFFRRSDCRDDCLPIGNVKMLAELCTVFMILIMKSTI
jgi:hypothetical protein